MSRQAIRNAIKALSAKLPNLAAQEAAERDSHARHHEKLNDHLAKRPVFVMIANDTTEEELKQIPPDELEKAKRYKKWREKRDELAAAGHRVFLAFRDAQQAHDRIKGEISWHKDTLAGVNPEQRAAKEREAKKLADYKLLAACIQEAKGD